MNKQDLLIEIGTEELPPKALPALSKAFQQEIEKGLKLNNLVFEHSRIFATPRRLAVLVSALPTMQDAVTVEKYGPALMAAFDDQGNPSKAAEGFARSCGVAVADLQQKNDGKVEKLYFSAEREGEQTTHLLPEIINHALAALPIPKRMRWGASREEFVRPVHWAVVLFGDQVVSTPILGIQSGNETRGHRFHHPQAITLTNPAEYESALSDSAFVIADFNARKEKIRQLVEAQAQQISAFIDLDEELLNEVTALVEWPVALTGSFNERYLEVPKEALISSLKKHQKCFYLEDNKGNIKPNFITVSNLESLDPDKVISGNEKVIGPRLADADFFFNQDKKHSLASRRDKLQTVIFEQSLGTVFDKTERVAQLSSYIVDQTGADSTYAIRAAQLAKCDLLTGMVGEFADLQGTIGQYYAQHDGEPDEVAQALREQYLPRFAGDALPESSTGIVLALAERIDTIVGLFGIGQPPTGSKDPYALRRAALGILRIIVEKQLNLDLASCINNAIGHFTDLAVTENLQNSVLDFIFDRFRAWYQDEGISVNIFQAVDAVRTASPLDFDLRIKAVNQFSTMPEAEALSAANKRVSNILSKLDKLPSPEIDPSLLTEAAEIQLAEKLGSLLITVKPLLEQQDYNKALAEMATLQINVDRFFDEVMVNTDDENIRNNRQSLLQQLRQLFLQIADISLLQSS
jgi:glycyl-tRNA synthetase beta chain